MARFFRNNRFHKGEEGESFLKLFVSKRLLHGAATSLLTIFLPIFLYEVSGGLFLIVGSYYAALSLIYVLLLSPMMQVINKIGFSHALVVSGGLSVLMNLVLYFLSPENFQALIVPLLFVTALFTIFHWVPFHVDFTLFSSKEARGKQIGLTMATIAFMGVVGPILAGFIIANAGYQALFGVVIVLTLAATVSYALVPETRTKFTWSVKKTWREFFDRKYRPVIAGEFASGAEIVIDRVVWPIFLFEILRGNVLEIGAVSTFVVAVAIVVQLFMGNYLDVHKNSKERTLKVGSSLYAVGWILKMFVLSALHVFFVGLYHNIVRIFTRTPYNKMLYDISADQGRYMDEFTVLREMANHLGRAGCLTIVAFMSIFISIEWTFIIAAIASIALNFIYYHHHQ